MLNTLGNHTIRIPLGDDNSRWLLLENKVLLKNSGPNGRSAVNIKYRSSISLPKRLAKVRSTQSQNKLLGSPTSLAHKLTWFGWAVAGHVFDARNAFSEHNFWQFLFYIDFTISPFKWSLTPTSDDKKETPRKTDRSQAVSKTRHIFRVLYAKLGNYWNSWICGTLFTRIPVHWIGYWHFW